MNTTINDTIRALAALLIVADYEDDSAGPAHLAARTALAQADSDTVREAQYIADAVARVREGYAS